MHKLVILRNTSQKYLNKLELLAPDWKIISGRRPIDYSD